MIASRLVSVLLLALCGCSASREAASAEREQTAVVGERFSLPHAGTASLGDLRITFSAVTVESRCPKSVVCVWAGDAAILLEVRKGVETRTVELHTSPPQPRTGDAFGYRIELVDLEPYPDAPGDLKPSAYLAHLVVEREGKDDR